MTLPRTHMTRDELLDALEAGALVATGNARLSRGLAAEFDRRMLARGRAAWSTPAVLPLSAWLPEVFSDCGLRAGAPLPRILTAEQEEQVWNAVIRQEGGGLQPALLRVEATARRAREAYALLCEWQLDLADRRCGDSEDAAVFRRWALRFRALLAERGQAVAAQIPALLRPLLAPGPGPLPQRMLLAGFYELNPAQQALLTDLRGAGCEADWVDLRGSEGQAVRLRADDARHEMNLAAAWARRILEQRPEARIGIVAPDLAARRSALASTLGKTLDPAALAPGAPLAPRPWNISLGQPLRDQPVVATALRLLALTRQPVDTESLGTLLLSPHWALPREPVERRAEFDRRALLDRRIRALGDARMRLSNLWYQAGGRADGDERAARPWQSALLTARLAALLEGARELPARAECADWATAFSGWLKAAGWSGSGNGVGSGNRPLDSHEFQTVDAWNALLSRFSGLSDFAGTLTAGEALALLGRLAGETLFQPRSGDAPVQVLGLYEAIGQSFEHLWVMGLHDGAWPTAAAPDPFIPLGLQREHCLPHSGPEVELAWAGEVTAALRASAAEVVFSHPGRDGNEELACSPLIAALPELAAAAAANFLRDAPGDRWQQAMRESAAPEIVAATALAPAPIALRNAAARGGSRLLADQAACPFRAFANHRLGAEPLERPQAGLDARRKGSLLHQVLERVWQALQSQSNLLAMQADELTDLVRATIGEVLEAQRRRSPATFTPRLAAVEAQRLEQRVLAWLELERQRSPFTVAACEQKRQFAAGGLRLGVKIDRIDRLEDGSLVVLDYKTGKVAPAAWFGERPEEPQLPLYGVVSRTAFKDVGDGEVGDGKVGAAPVAAVAYALIQADGAGFSGVARDGGILPGLPPSRKGPLQEASENWPAVLDDWAAELERLTTAFQEGEAAVDPKHGLKTCERHYCELGPLCRVRELPAGAGGAAEEDADD